VSRADLEIALGNGKLKGALARAFKGAPLTIPADLADRIEQGLKRATLDRLGIELRAGNLVLGTERLPNRRDPARLRGWPMPAMPRPMAWASLPRPGAWAKWPKGLAWPASSCRWTGRRCLWHWAATTSFTLASPMRARPNGLPVRWTV
jgi:hypothetical protein